MGTFVICICSSFQITLSFGIESIQQYLESNDLGEFDDDFPKIVETMILSGEILVSVKHVPLLIQ